MQEQRWHLGAMKQPGHRALRKGRVSIPQQVYLVTVVSRRRKPRFEHFEVACAVARIMGDCNAWHDARVLAWVLMPDHWHALIQLGESSPLSVVLQRINSLTARAANLACGERGQVWQSAYHDRALRSAEDVRTVARYLVANPLRAGLVEKAEDWPYVVIPEPW